METGERNARIAGDFGPTYKSLFFGACIVIGTAFGWWFTNFISNTEAIHAKYDERITELEARAQRDRWELDVLHKDFEEVKRGR